MSFSALDFLSDVQHRLHSRLPAAPNLPVVEFLRVVNFVEHRFVVRVQLGDERVGEIQCREVEEPQDRYIRGVFMPSDPQDTPTHFTVRRDRTYEPETELLTGALLMRCFTLLPTPTSPIPVPPPPPVEEKASYVIPGANFDPSALFGNLEEEPNPDESPATETAAKQFSEAASNPKVDAVTMYDDSGKVVNPEPDIPDAPFDPAALFGKNPAAENAETPSGLPPPPFDPAALFGGSSSSEEPAQEEAAAADTPSGLPASPFDPEALFGKNPEAENAETPSGLPPPPFDPAALFGGNSSSEEPAQEKAAAADTPSGLPASPFDPEALFGKNPEAENAETPSGLPPPPFDPVALFGGGPAAATDTESPAADSPSKKKKKKGDEA